MPIDPKSVTEALLANQLMVGKHGIAEAPEPYGEFGHIDEEGAWAPNRKILQHQPLTIAELCGLVLEDPQTNWRIIERMGEIAEIGEQLDRIIGRRSWVDSGGYTVPLETELAGEAPRVRTEVVDGDKLVVFAIQDSHPMEDPPGAD
jgi:hypothetical protein